jgi:hypothetical protein
VDKKASHEQLHLEHGEQTVPLLPSHTLENKTPDFTEESKQLKKKQGRIEDLVSEMGGAIDVVRIPTQNDDRLENEEIPRSKSEQYSDKLYSRSVPNISIFDSTSEDFPIESNSSRQEVNERQINRGEMMSAEIRIELEDKPLPPTARTDDFLEYQADDSDRVYAVRKYAEGENMNDKDKDADNSSNGGLVQHNLSDKVETSESGDAAAIESEILAQLEDHTVEEVRLRYIHIISLAVYCHPQVLRRIQLLIYVSSIGS